MTQNYYVDDTDANGKQPEEIAMMPKPGWSEDKGAYSDNGNANALDNTQQTGCGIGSCQPAFLQGFKKVWAFAAIVGGSSLFTENLQHYLTSQVAFLRRQYEMDESVGLLLSLPSPIATLFTVLFLSVIARRVHIPRVLAVLSLVAGVLSLVCIIPFLVSKGDLTDPPVIAHENKTWTVERIQYGLPSCLLRRYPLKLRLKMMAMMEEKMPTIKPTIKPTKKPTKKPELATTGATKASTTTPTPTTMVPEGSGVTIMMPNFQKLSKHSIYSSLVLMAKGMGIDLEKVGKMTLPEQVKYLKSLPPHFQSMLPSLKSMLGENQDQYFFSYELPKERRRRDAVMPFDLMHSGDLSNLMKLIPPVPEEMYWKLAKESCFYNTKPFHKADHSGVVLGFLVLSMILHGIAVAPRLALIVTFIDDNTNEMGTATMLGLFTALANLGPLVTFVLSLLSFTSYATLEDTGLMTYLNPRWVAAWWLGFFVLGVFSLLHGLPLFLFPSKIKASRKYSTKQGGAEDQESCVGWIVQEMKGVFPSLFRLMTNKLYLLVLVGSTLTYMAWNGVLHILVNYVSHQFALEPMVPGISLYVIQGVIAFLGTLVGGVIASKAKMSAVSCLKMAAILSCIMAVLYGANIGFGCDQPELDKGNKIVKNVSTTDMCGKTCVCVDLGYAPVCGSDGISYYSACHAGCGDPYDGLFHDCKCIEDQQKTAKLNMCKHPCNLFYAFCAAFLLGALAFGLRLAPLLLSSYRCVDFKDIPAALGLKFFYFVLFGHIVTPYIFGSLEDGTCTVRRPECGVFPTCALHDIAAYRINVFVTSFVLEAVGALLLLAAFFLGRRPTSKYNKRVFDKDQTK